MVPTGAVCRIEATFASDHPQRVKFNVRLTKAAAAIPEWAGLFSLSFNG